MISEDLITVDLPYDEEFSDDRLSGLHRVINRAYWGTPLHEATRELAKEHLRRDKNFDVKEFIKSCKKEHIDELASQINDLKEIGQIAEDEKKLIKQDIPFIFFDFVKAYAQQYFSNYEEADEIKVRRIMREKTLDSMKKNHKEHLRTASEEWNTLNLGYAH